jgi:hypothetical protein
MEKRKYTFRGISEKSLDALLKSKQEREYEVQKKWEQIKIDNKLACKVCAVEKTLEHYSRINLNRNLVYECWSSECKNCENQRKKLEKERAAQNKGLDYNIHVILREIKRRTNQYNRDIDIDETFLNELYNKQNGICPYTGLQMSFDINSYQRLSLDRIDSNAGYIKTNVVWCCWIANNMKQSMSIEQMKFWIASIQKTINSG